MSAATAETGTNLSAGEGGLFARRPFYLSRSMPQALADLFLDDLESLGVPRDPDPEHLRLLAERYRGTGGRVDRDALILALASRVHEIVRKDRRCRRYPHLAGDLLGVALLALVSAVADWKGEDEIRASVELDVRRRIDEAITKERKHRGSGRLNYWVISLDFDWEGARPDDREFLELLEGFDDQDRTILLLREEGWTGEEIGLIIGHGKTFVYDRLKFLRGRHPGGD